jgi:hypothetical protein
MKKWLGLIFTTVLACAGFTGCDDDSDSIPGGPPSPVVLTNIEAVETYLAKQGGANPDNPVELVVKIDATEWQQLFEAIYNADKYAALDLSQCFNVPTEFSGSAAYGKKTVSLVLPEGITSIGEGACYGWTVLERIDLPASITSIGRLAFSNCTSLENITLPASVTEIVREAFYQCTNLSVINFPENLASIGEYAFYDCTSLGRIELPASLTSIGQRGFQRCSSLYYVRCHAVNPPELTRDPLESFTAMKRHFEGTASNLTIRVPYASVAAYKAAWSEYADKIRDY